MEQDYISQIKKLSKEEIEELVLKMNKDYWESRYNNDYVHSSNYYKHEGIIKLTIEYCFNELSTELCLELFDVFKQNQVDFDARSYINNNTLLLDFANKQFLSNSQTKIKKFNENYYNRMKILLDYGANPDFYRNTEHNEKLNCLIASIHDRDRFKLLLNYGADPFFTPNNQWNNLFYYIDDRINQIEKNHAHFDLLGEIPLQGHMEDVKTNRNHLKSILECQQMTDWLQSIKSNTGNTIQFNPILSNHNKVGIKNSKISTTEQESLINNRKQKPML